MIFLLFAFFAHGDPQVMEGLKLENIKADTKNIFLNTSDVVVVDSKTALVVKGGKLSYVDLNTNKTASPMKLPLDCTRISLVLRAGRAARDILCFGKKAGSDDKLQIYSGAGKFTPILKTPKKIFAAGGNSDRLFFVISDGLYQIRPRDGIRPVFASSLVTGVKSLVFDSENDVVYMATTKEVMSLRGGMLDVLVQGLGGSLSLLDKHLVIVDSGGRVVRLGGLNELLVKRK